MDAPSHGIEPELTDRTPHAARFTGGTQVGRLAVLALTAGGLWLVCWLASRDLGDLVALRAAGRPTTARVTGRHESHGKSTTYYLDYEFEGNGQQVEDDEAVSESEYDDTSIGTAIPVVYLPSDPQTHRIGAVNDARIARSRTAWGVGALVTLIVLGGILWANEATRRNHLRLLREGVPVVGVVLDRNVVQAKSTTYYVQYRFTAPPASAQVKKVSVTKRLYDECAPGTPLTVLHEYARPANNVPYRALSDVRLT